MKFVIRVDDIGWTAEPAEEKPLKKPDAGLRHAKRLHEALGGIPWLAGVIPAALDNEGRAWLASRPPGLTVAMHGVTHRRTDGFDSEFRGRTTPDCEGALRRGIDLLGMKTRHFIPPFNCADPELMLALRATGFEAVWGQYSTMITPPSKVQGLTFVPSLFDLYSSTLAGMGPGQEPLVGKINQFLAADGYAVITLHVTWELAKCDQGNFQGVRELCRRLEDRVISPDRYLQEAR